MQASNNLSDFLEVRSEEDKLQNYSIGSKRSFQSDVLSQEGRQKQIVTVPQSFIKGQYPSDLSSTNIFCPLCGKIVTNLHKYLFYYSTIRRKRYLAHQECLTSAESKKMKVANGSEARLQSVAYLTQPRSIALGGKEYLLEMEVLHPVSGHSFLKLWTKEQAFGAHNNIIWEIRRPDDADCFSPNVVAFPIPDFELMVSMTQMGDRESKVVRKVLINLGRLGGNEVQLVRASNRDLEITLRVIGSKEEQQNIIEEMNTKYRYPTEIGIPIVELIRIQAKLPSGDSDDEDDKSSIFDFKSQKSSRRLDAMTGSGALEERTYERQKLDLETLIKSGNLGEYVRQNTQSRVFQGWLGDASPQQIDRVVSSLSEEFPQLITHDYANYMVQKLMSVCLPQQRLKIVQRIMGDIPVIARNKQGTHSLQTLIGLFTLDDEFKLVCSSVKPSFLTLSQHANATHLLQKIISIFPLKYTSSFMNTVTQDFLSYALDKNAMCVIKQMLKKISEFEKEAVAEAPELRKQFIHSATFALDQLMLDPYGNYVLQFCYELFGEVKCGSITERILEKFCQLATQKYASSVVTKCVGTFWSEKETINRLRNVLTPQVVAHLFGNREGNRVLLEIVQKQDDRMLKEKVQSQVAMGDLSRFNHDRWGMTLGSRSGTVKGFASFTDNRKHNRKHKRY